MMMTAKSIMSWSPAPPRLRFLLVMTDPGPVPDPDPDPDPEPEPPPSPAVTTVAAKVVVFFAFVGGEEGVVDTEARTSAFTAAELLLL